MSLTLKALIKAMLLVLDGSREYGAQMFKGNQVLLIRIQVVCTVFLATILKLKAPYNKKTLH